MSEQNTTNTQTSVTQQSNLAGWQRLLCLSLQCDTSQHPLRQLAANGQAYATSALARRVQKPNAYRRQLQKTNLCCSYSTWKFNMEALLFNMGTMLFKMWAMLVNIKIQLFKMWMLSKNGGQPFPSQLQTHKLIH